MGDEHGGRLCTVCKQFCLLPLTCTACEKPFCELHCSVEAHSCSNADSQVKQVVCTKVVGVPKASASSAVAPLRPNRCIQCGQSSLLGGSVPLSCSFCQKPVCVAHRHRFDHVCPDAETIIAAERSARMKDAADGEGDTASEDEDHSDKTSYSIFGGDCSCIQKLMKWLCLH